LSASEDADGNFVVERALAAGFGGRVHALGLPAKWLKIKVALAGCFDSLPVPLAGRRFFRLAFEGEKRPQVAVFE